MLKDYLLSTIVLPDTVTPEYYDSIDPFSVESIWQLSYRDLTRSNIHIENKNKLSELCFNSQTVFPNTISQVARVVLEDGKKETLSNHTGLTGKDIKVAVIDRPIPVEHIEFQDRIRYIEVIPGHESNAHADFHGTTCASYLCGKNCGVAQSVELFYYAIPNHTQPIKTYYEWQLQALGKIVEYNRRNDDPIRVVSLSAPFQIDQMSRRNELEKELALAGCTLIDATMFMRNFSGIDYDPYAQTYGLNRWQIDKYEQNRHREGFAEYFNGLCFVPSARRTAATCDSVDEYVHFSKIVSESWTIPHLAGAFAICLEKNNRLSYDEFVRIAKTCPKKNGFTILNLDHIVRSL